MKMYPSRHKAYTIEGQNLFPLYAASGSFLSSRVGYLFTGLPDAFNGRDLGSGKEVQSDDGGSWIAVHVAYGDTESDVAHKVRIAEDKLDGKL